MRPTVLLLLLLTGCSGVVVVITPGMPDAAEEVDAGEQPVEDAGVDAGVTEDAGTAVDAGLPWVQRLDAGLLWRDGGTGEEPSFGRLPFTWRMAGAFIVHNDALTASPQQLLADHFSYVGDYAMNNCANNTPPYSCANNGCTYPGNPGSSGEIPDYATLAAWLKTYQQAGLYAGIWGVTTTNAEAEGHCFAEVANTLRSQHGVTIDLVDVDGEKAYETVQSASQRFVTEFNATLQFNPAKAYTPECHTAVPLTPWLSGGFTSIMPMAYWNDTNTNPSYCLNWSLAYGAPLPKAQVMLDGYKHGTPHSWTDYANDMQGVQAAGFSIWRTVGASEWDLFKPLIETKGIAVYSGGAVSGPLVVAAALVDGDPMTSVAGPATFDLGSARLTNGVRVVASMPFTLEVDPNDCAFDDAVTVMPTYAPRITRCVRVNATNVAELEVHRNLAREATVTASSAWDPATFPLTNLIDGKRGNIMHTKQEPGAWVKVNLGKRRSVDRVVLWNRQDCCQDRLKSYVVELDPNDCAFDDPVRVADVTNAPAGAPTSWAFAPVTARCVRVKQKEDMPLHASELQVFGY